MVLCAPGCGDSGARQSDSRGSLPALGKSRVRSDAAPAVAFGRRGDRGPIVIPLRPTDAAIACGSVSIELSDAETVTAPLHFVAEVPSASPAVAFGPASWLGPHTTWRAYRPTERPRDVAGLWVAAVALDEREPARIKVDGRTMIIRWTAEDEPHTSEQAAAVRPTVAAVLAGVMHSPLDRWRVRLAGGRSILAAADPSDAIDDPVLDGLAHQIELQWDAALRHVDVADAVLGERLRRCLAGVCGIDGEPVPIWTEPRERLESLRRELLAEGLTAKDAIEIANAHLAAPAPTGAVIRDDAAAVNLKSGSAYPSVLLVNLSSSPAAAWIGRRAQIRGGGTPGEMLRLESFDASTLTFPSDLRVPDDTTQSPVRPGTISSTTSDKALADVVPGVLRFECGVGDWIGERVAIGRIAPVRPPGMTVGPMLSDWSQATFVRAITATSPDFPMPAIDAAHGVVGRLFRTADAGAKWTLYLECASPAAAAAERSTVALYLGPRSRETRIEVNVNDGSMREFRSGREASTGKATLMRSADYVAIWIAIPADAIETAKAGRSGRPENTEGLLRFGLTRTTFAPDGTPLSRGTWPRPMLPWESEPSRIAVDLSTWAPVNE